MQRLFPNTKFIVSSEWVGFSCNYSCILMIDPTETLFQRIGKAYNLEVIKMFGTAHFYSADVFNEMTPKSNSSEYLMSVNKAVFDSINSVDPESIWVMQAWVFNQNFWNYTKVEAFLSGIPIGKLLLLDLYSETLPHYNQYSSYFGHKFIWNLLHNFGGANGIFGPLNRINQGPTLAENFPNSSMIGIGLTMEGINQNEMIYDFFLEKSWRSNLSQIEIEEWIGNFTIRRYSTLKNPANDKLKSIWIIIANVLYTTEDYQNKQLFTKRPTFNLISENVTNIDKFFDAWKEFVSLSTLSSNELFLYDLVDLTKEVLRFIFNQNYEKLKISWRNQKLYEFNKISTDLLDVLNDMELILNSDKHFLLSNWLNDAKSKGKNDEEKSLYEFNARLQVSLWGLNNTEDVFDYACKAWAGLIKDYYMKRWKIFFKQAEKAIIQGKPLDIIELNQLLLINSELPFIESKLIHKGPEGKTK